MFYRIQTKTTTTTTSCRSHQFNYMNKKKHENIDLLCTTNTDVQKKNGRNYKRISVSDK